MSPLKRALLSYRERCRNEIGMGGSVPFIAHRMMIRVLLRRMRTKRSRVVGLGLESREMTALGEAFDSYISVCRCEMAEGSMVPFAHDVAIIGKLQERMRADGERAFWKMVAAAAKSVNSQQ